MVQILAILRYPSGYVAQRYAPVASCSTASLRKIDQTLFAAAGQGGAGPSAEEEREDRHSHLEMLEIESVVVLFDDVLQ